MSKEVKKDIEALKKLGLTKPGFSTPENYFEEFSDTLFTRLEEESLPNETGFKTPNLYFENFEKNLFDKIETPNKGNSTKIRVLYAISSVAAMVILYLGIQKYNASQTITFDSITVTDIHAYIESGNMDIDSYTLASVDNTINLTSLEDELISSSASEINEYLDTVDSDYLFLEN